LAISKNSVLFLTHEALVHYSNVALYWLMKVLFYCYRNVEVTSIMVWLCDACENVSCELYDLWPVLSVTVMKAM